uniref:PPM-type phosphatase domain-containing protein n=1 Tax=Macrostomum lignano TaxID=282301 RepID=A0A1I8GKH0_9PLAT
PPVPQLSAFTSETLSMSEPEPLATACGGHAAPRHGHRRAAQPRPGAAGLNRALLRVALSGCVGTACTRDVRLLHHRADNQLEPLMRLPSGQRARLPCRYDRLLGELMPLRAFGDIRYKWSADLLRTRRPPAAAARHLQPCRSYYTPPYLTAEPDFATQQITGDDRFLILASDGLWDHLPPEDAVAIVGAAIDSGAFGIGGGGGSSGSDAEEVTESGRSGANLATLLVRAALGGQKRGDSEPSEAMITQLLSAPANVARYYRDDITVAVLLLH